MDQKKEKEILSVFPIRFREMIAHELRRHVQIQEIRLRVNRPICFLVNGQEISLSESGKLTIRDLQEIMELISRFSLYAYEEEIRQGFLTIKGGHRVGIAGKAVVSQGSIKTIRNISFIHLRIAQEYPDCAGTLLPHVYQNGILQNTLIVSAPGQGKTTLLRDLIRLISMGNYMGSPMTVSVIDERGELAACNQGIPQNDLGPQTDVLDGCPKTEGMHLMLRSMTPQVLAVDEIFGEEDMQAIREAAGCGCIMLATAHGESVEALLKKESFFILQQERIFTRFIQLKNDGHPGRWQAVYDEAGHLIVQN